VTNKITKVPVEGGIGAKPGSVGLPGKMAILRQVFPDRNEQELYGMAVSPMTPAIYQTMVNAQERILQTSNPTLKPDDLRAEAVRQLRLGGFEPTSAQPAAAPAAAGARPAWAPANAAQAPDGNWYVPDPNNQGKYLKVNPP
jgi:hypothetical protein